MAKRAKSEYLYFPVKLTLKWEYWWQLGTGMRQVCREMEWNWQQKFLHFCPIVVERAAKTVKYREDHLFNIWCWYNWISICKILPYKNQPHKKISSKWTMKLSLRAKTIKLLKENIEESSWLWARQSVVRHDPKSRIHKRKKIIRFH
jgi:hypothetical protein